MKRAARNKKQVRKVTLMAQGLQGIIRQCVEIFQANDIPVDSASDLPELLDEIFEYVTQLERKVNDPRATAIASSADGDEELSLELPLPEPEPVAPSWELPSMDDVELLDGTSSNETQAASPPAVRGPPDPSGFKSRLANRINRAETEGVSHSIGGGGGRRPARGVKKTPVEEQRKIMAKLLGKDLAAPSPGPVQKR